MIPFLGNTPLINQLARYGAGIAAEKVGSVLGIPETNISEWIAGGATPDTSKKAYAGDYQQPSTGQTVSLSSAQPMQNFNLNTGVGLGGNNNNNSVRPTGDNNTGQPSGPSYEDVLRNQINDMYNGLEGALPGQRANQEQIATNSYNQSLSDLGSQQAESSAQLDTQRRKVNENQVKTLADVTDNLRNAFQAGNVYLGARGAGDSSAANQYSYALTNLANKQRGDVLANSASNLNDIADREASLGRVVTQEKTRLKSEFDNSLLSIAQWFSDAQNQLKQYRGQDLQNLSAQVYNNAVARVNALQQGFQNRQAALESWAVSNARNLSELKTNMQGISAFNPTMASAQPLTGTPMVGSDGNMRVPTGFGFGSDNRRKDAFGNPIV